MAGQVGASHWAPGPAPAPVRSAGWKGHALVSHWLLRFSGCDAFLKRKESTQAVGSTAEGGRPGGARSTTGGSASWAACEAELGQGQEGHPAAPSKPAVMFSCPARVPTWAKAGCCHTKGSLWPTAEIPTATEPHPSFYSLCEQVAATAVGRVCPWGETWPRERIPQRTRLLGQGHGLGCALGHAGVLPCQMRSACLGQTGRKVWICCHLEGKREERLMPQRACNWGAGCPCGRPGQCKSIHHALLTGLFSGRRKHWLFAPWGAVLCQMRSQLGTWAPRTRVGSAAVLPLPPTGGVPLELSWGQGGHWPPLQRTWTLQAKRPHKSISRHQVCATQRSCG